METQKAQKQRMKEYQFRCPDTLPGSDPSIGRRISCGDNHWNSKTVLLHGWKNDPAKYNASKGVYVGKKNLWLRKHVKLIAFMLGLMGFILLIDSLMMSIFDLRNFQHHLAQRKSTGLKEEDRDAYINEEKSPVMYDRLLNLASSALAEKEFKQESSRFLEEPYQQASAWKPCSDRKVPMNMGKFDKNNGYILISANGGLNQQRVAICNAVAVASLLNATLVLPRFLYSNVWKDPSQFGDIYQEEYFMSTLKDEVNIVKDLPLHLSSLDFEALGSLKLRCKCNFHALKFVPKIQQAGSLLVRRIRKYDAARRMLDKQLLGNFVPKNSSNKQDTSRGPSKYLALHLRFEVDMVAYSLCEFGGGENEKKDLQAYRETHFPLLIERLKNSSPISPTKLRKLGRCPLTPEEAALVLAGLGFKRGTYIYLAGSHIYGGESRMYPFTSLYPNLVTKESLLTSDELAPFRNFSSQLAALDFIACATADVFAITDSGSQLSSLVSGFRTYYGGGHAPTLRPNKKRLAAILSENSTIGWNGFEDRVKKMIEEGQRVRARGFGRSIYRQPRCPECMCKEAR
ncbi:o-fucosyltransferase 8 [Quercus suber]|uniref:O-fucosyltransferase family protein n=1 Tax=Quercus suber TaxID=58331 RepID=A0AAW0L2W3_QUESU